MLSPNDSWYVVRALGTPLWPRYRVSLHLADGEKVGNWPCLTARGAHRRGARALKRWRRRSSIRSNRLVARWAELNRTDPRRRNVVRH